MLLFTGCEEPVRESVEIPLQIVLPAGEYISPNYAPERDLNEDAPRRVLGDPGQQEVLKKPTHAYFFCVFETTGDVITVVSFEKTMADTEWVMQGIDGDSCYVHNGKVPVKDTPPPDSRVAIRVYVAVSDTALIMTYDKAGTPTVIDFSNAAKCPTTEEQVQNITFKVDRAMHLHLQNIYSSPFNKEEDDEYYGTVKVVYTDYPFIHLMLYHVASKVDLTWNVPTDKQGDLHITNVTVKHRYEGESYLFKPTKNEHAKFTGGTDTVLVAGSVGTYWAGRAYMYTIPYLDEDSLAEDKKKFPLQVNFGVQEADETAKQYRLTISQSMSDEVYVPWVRGNLTFSKPLTSDKDTLIVR